MGLRKTPPSTGTVMPEAPNTSAVLPSPAQDTLAKKPSPYTAHRASLAASSPSTVVKVAFKNEELAGTLWLTGSRQLSSCNATPPPDDVKGE